MRAQLHRTCTLISFFIVGALLGCTPAVHSSSKFRTGENIQIGQDGSAFVGQIIYEKFNYQAVETATLVDPFNTSITFGTVTFEAGRQLKLGELQGEKAYCASDGAKPMGLSTPTGPACAFDADDDGSFESVRGQIGAFFHHGIINPPAAYQKSEQASQGGWRRELIFLGIDGTTLRVGYREYDGDLARPAFSEDLTYPIRGDGTSVIRYKNLTIDVMKATGDMIQFTIVNSL